MQSHAGDPQNSNSAKITIKDFEIQGPLGEGSFGKVYLALQKGSKKHVAVKVLDKYHIMKVKSSQSLNLITAQQS